MAQDKKVFEIKINGLTESVDAVKSLNKELNTLGEKLKSLQNAKINIKVQGNTPDTTKTKVSGNTGTNSQVEKQTQQQNALAKLQQQIAQQQAKNAALVTDEYQQQYQELVKIREANKEVEQVQKQIATGVRDTNGEYTNTLQGQRAYLSELQKTFNSQEMGTEEWRKAADELLRVRELVKGIEQSTGDYRRNVGNYPSGAKELVTLFQEYQTQIEETNRSLNELKDSMRGLSQDSDEYKKIAVQVSELEDKLSETTETAKGLNDELSKKIQINVGSTVQYFDDVDQAAENLQKQLRALALEGQQGTKQWNDTINAYGRVQKAIMATTREVDAFVASSTGLKQTIAVMQGFSGLASLGVGIQGLFGGQNEELDKSLQKFTQLTLVMQGLQTVQKQMQTEGDAFGRIMKQWWEWANKGVSVIGSLIAKIPGIKQLGQATKSVFEWMGNKGTQIKSVIDYNSVQAEIKKVEKELNDLPIRAENTWIKQYSGIFTEISDLAAKIKIAPDTEGLNAVKKTISGLEAQLSDLNEMDLRFGGNVPEIQEDIADITKELDKWKDIQLKIETGDTQGALDAVNEQLQTMATDLNNVGNMSDETAKKYAELTTKLSELNVQSKESQKNLGTFGTALSKMGGFGKVAASALIGIGKAAKIAAGSLKAMAASTVILLAIQLALEAVMYLIEGVTKLWNSWTGAYTAKLVENFDGLAASIENANNKLQDLNKQTERKRAEGSINSYQELKEKLDNVTKAAQQAGLSLKQFVSDMENTKDIDLKTFETDTWWNSEDSYSSMNDFKKRYQTLVKAVSQGVDEMEAKTGSGSWWFTADDAKSDLAEMQKAIIGKLQYDINNIDFSKGEEAYRQFINLINDETNASALANIDELFPEDKWQQGLKQRIDAYRNFAEQMYDLNTQMATQTAAIARQIQDNLNAAISDPYQRANAQRKTAMERELEEAEGNAELQSSIRKKYAREEADARKAHQKQLAADAKAARQKALQNQYTAMQAEIDLMEDGLEKQKKILELQKKQAVDAAREQGASKATIAKIVESYDRQILKLELEFTKNIEKLYKTRNQNLLQLELEYLAQLKEVDRSIWDRQMDIKKQIEDFAQQDYEFSLNFEITNNPPIEEYVNNLVGYYTDLEKAQQQYVERKKKLDIEAENEQYDRDTNDAYEQYRERERAYSQWLETQNELLKQSLEEGLITQQEFDRMEQENHNKANEYLEDENAKYIANIEQMDKDHQQRLAEIDRNATDQKRQYTKEALDNIIQTYNDFYNEIEQAGERQTKKNTSGIGIINFKKERANLKNMQSQYTKLMADIQKEYQDLQTKFDNNEISFNDFRLAKKELDGLSAEITEKYNDVSNNLKNLFTTVVQSVMQATQQYVQAFSSIWSSISSLMEMSLDNEQRRLEKEQELLEEEYDMLEEQYQKQEELEKKHTDRVNSIEDELKTARGDRRENLINQLAQEKNAQIKALENERAIEKEKEQNQKKQKQLEKQQEALEKKRWEQNKRNQIVQATINTFTAVTNALAVQPWFVGLALSAVALALGMANVAKIKAQKYYADGGLLTGKSHSQGGIKIPGTNIEVEGNEYVINKTTTKYNQPLVEYINSKRRPITKEDLINFYDNGQHKLINKNLTGKYAEGGQLPVMNDIDVRDLVNYQQPQDNAQYVVSVVDIINAADNVRSIQTLAGINK